MPLGMKVLPHKKGDLKLCFIRLIARMKSRSLRVWGYTELQKSKFTPKLSLGREVTQDTAQGSVTATQLDVDEISIKGSEYLTRMINILHKTQLV